jgi:hypothetical protein
MDVPERTLFLVGFGWAGLASVLTWLVPFVTGAPVSENGIELLFGVAILAGVSHAVYNDTRHNPSTISLVFAVAAALFSTLELVRVF